MSEEDTPHRTMRHKTKTAIKAEGERSMDDDMLFAMAKASIKVLFENAHKFLSKPYVMANATKEDDWNNSEMTSQAFETLLLDGFIEQHSEGFCKKGNADRLRKEAGKPTNTRSEFNKLTPQQKMDFVNAGGIIR